MHGMNSITVKYKSKSLRVVVVSGRVQEGDCLWHATRVATRRWIFARPINTHIMGGLHLTEAAYKFVAHHMLHGPYLLNRPYLLNDFMYY